MSDRLDPRDEETFYRILRIAGAVIFLIGFALGYVLCVIL
jgi:preprotein translocase subunit Sss1